MEGLYPLRTAKGHMTDRHLFNPNNCLAVAINATSFKPSGIAKDLAFMLSYANLFENRRQLYNINRTITRDRPDVGTLIVKEPAKPESGFPIIAGLVCQFGPGEPVERNAVAGYYLQNSKDVHYVNGLASDTQSARRENFTKCLDHLADYVTNQKSIQNVFFPAGIGCRGKLDQEWKMVYVKELKKFSQRLDLLNIKTYLLEPGKEDMKIVKTEEEMDSQRVHSL